MHRTLIHGRLCFALKLLGCVHIETFCRSRIQCRTLSVLMLTYWKREMIMRHGKEREREGDGERRGGGGAQTLWPHTDKHELTVDRMNTLVILLMYYSINRDSCQFHDYGNSIPGYTMRAPPCYAIKRLPGSASPISWPVGHDIPYVPLIRLVRQVVLLNPEGQSIPDMPGRKSVRVKWFDFQIFEDSDQAGKTPTSPP